MSRRDQAHQRVLQTRSTRSITAVYKDACRLLQKRTHALESDWWERKAVELQRAADRKDMKSLKINMKKTEVLHQPNSTRTREDDIMVDGNKLTSVLEFTYIRSIIYSNGCIDDEIQRSMAKASASLGGLRQNNHHVFMRVRGKIYRAIMLSTLLFGEEAWTVYRRHVKKMHAFMMRHVRSIMTIT